MARPLAPAHSTDHSRRPIGVPDSRCAAPQGYGGARRRKILDRVVCAPTTYTVAAASLDAGAWQLPPTIGRVSWIIGDGLVAAPDCTGSDLQLRARWVLRHDAGEVTPAAATQATFTAMAAPGAVPR